MTHHGKIKILIVDDHFLVRIGLSGTLNIEPDMIVVAEAATGSHAIDLYRKHRPDIVLLDLRLPAMSGVEAAIAILREFPKARIIALSTYEGDEEIYRALQSGIRSYLPKSIARDELLAAIRAVHAGQHYLPPAIASRLAARMPRGELSARELDVLKLIVKGRSNKAIASALGITEVTVKLHVSNILGKMGVSDRTEAATSALQRGIVHLDA